MFVDKHLLHWHFALDSTIRRLEDLAWNFDADIEAKGYGYACVLEPNELIAVIDSFLAEPGLFQEGDLVNFRGLRQQFEQCLAPMFRAGQASALQYWTSASPEQQTQLAEYKFADFRRKAKACMPDNVSRAEQSWFVEGFCRSWQDQWTQYMASRFGKLPPTPK
jgi:hypothetical protein